MTAFRYCQYLGESDSAGKAIPLCFESRQYRRGSECSTGGPGVLDLPVLG